MANIFEPRSAIQSRVFIYDVINYTKKAIKDSKEEGNWMPNQLVQLDSVKPKINDLGEITKIIEEGQLLGLGL